jgi:hypothetical protein
MENEMLLSARAISKSLRARFPHAGRPQFQTILRDCLVFAALPVFAALAGWGPGGVIAVGQSPGQANALWVANAGAKNVVEFLPAQLQSGSSASAPHLVLGSAAFGAPQDVTFDATGDLWVVDAGDVISGGKATPAIYEFTAAQLAQLSTAKNPKPTATIKFSGIESPQRAVFDKQGNLWVSDGNVNAIYMFTRSQLSAHAADIAPTATIRANPAFYSPVGIAFNGDGDLYVANNGGENIYGFKASSLPTKSGDITLVPSITLDDGSGAIGIPWSMAFDGQGNLWCSDESTVMEFTQAQLAKSGDPTPNITLASTEVSNNRTLVSPYGITFDNNGNLLADSSAAPFGIAVYAKSQLVKGNKTLDTPATFLVGSSTTLNTPAGIVFGPVVQ